MGERMCVRVDEKMGYRMVRVYYESMYRGCIGLTCLHAFQSIGLYQRSFYIQTSTLLDGKGQERSERWWMVGVMVERIGSRCADHLF